MSIHTLPTDGDRKKVLPIPPPHYTQYGDVWVSVMADVPNAASPPPAGKTGTGSVPLRMFVNTTAGNVPPYWHGVGGTANNGLFTITAAEGRVWFKMNPGDLGLAIERTDPNEVNPVGILVEVYPA